MSCGTVLRWVALPVVIGVLVVRWLYLLAKRIGDDTCFSDCVSAAELDAAMWMVFAAILAWCVVIAWRYWPRDLSGERRDLPPD